MNKQEKKEMKQKAVEKYAKKNKITIEEAQTLLETTNKSSVIYWHNCDFKDIVEFMEWTARNIEWAKGYIAAGGHSQYK